MAFAMMEGVEFSTQLFSGRCIVLTVLTFSFAIYQYYSASIMSSLLIEKPRTIRTVQDVINSSLDVGVEDIPYNRNYFEVVGIHAMAVIVQCNFISI